MNKLAYLMSKVAAKEDLTPAERDELIVLMEQVQSGSTWANGIADGPTGISGAVIKTGSGNIIQDETGMKFYNDAILTGWIQLDGDFFIGSDLSSADTTTFSLFSNAQTYNGEAMTAGSVLFGSNSALKSNMLWDPATGRTNFRGGTTVQAYVGTDGVIYWGGGVGYLNTSGISIDASTSPLDTRAYKFLDPSDNVIGGLYGYYSDTDNFITIYDLGTTGKSSSVSLQSRCPDGKVAAISLNAQNTSATKNAQITLRADDEGADTSSILLTATTGGIKLTTIDNTGISLTAGGYVNEFSTDGTFAGNSDTAVPTEKAVVTYVAAQIAAAPSGGGNLSRGLLGI